MPKLLNDFLRPVTPSQIRGEDIYLPEVSENGVYPGMSTLSHQEVNDISLRVFSDYMTTNLVGGVPSATKFMENISWVIFAYAYETEADQREARGEALEAELLRDTARLIIDLQDVEHEQVIDTGHLLSTSAVLKMVQNDILQILLQNRLSVSYLDGMDQLHYQNLPKGGFTTLM